MQMLSEKRRMYSQASDEKLTISAFPQRNNKNPGGFHRDFLLIGNQSYKGRFIYLDELCDVVEETLGLNVETPHSFCTDREYSVLPEDVKRWINLLYAAGVRVPEAVF